MPEQGEPLSERELELLQLVATGATNRQIAQDLQISVNTVKVHVRNILAKLGAASRTEATVIAVREGLVTVEGSASAGSRQGSAPGVAVVGAEAALAPDRSEDGGRPLPWPKRIALIVVPLLVGSAVLLSRPSVSLPSAPDPGDLPPESQPAGDGAVDSEADSQWQDRAQMPTPRAYFGMVAVGNRLYAIGGRGRSGASSAVEVYDPTVDIWSRESDLPAPKAYISAAAIGADIYVPGGCGTQFQPSRDVAVYSTELEEWRTVAPMPEGRCAYAIAAVGQRLHVIGGWDGEGYVETVYIYDPLADEWQAGVPLGEPRGFAAAAALDDSVYVVGGYDGSRELTTCDRLDAGATSWAPCAPLTLGRGGLGLAALGQQLFAVGGGGWESYLGFSERYEPGTNSWHPTETPLTGEWRSPGVAVLDHRVFATGGWSGGYLSVNQAYDVLRYRIFIPVSETQ